MAAQDKALELLLELGNPSVRRTRAEQLEHALRTALALTDGDAAVVLAPTGRRTERLLLHAGSPATALLPAPPQGSVVVRSLIENPQPLALPDLSEDPRLVAGDGCPGVEAGPVLFAALWQRDPAPGYLGVFRRRGRARFSPAEVRALALLTGSLANSLESLRLSSGAEKVALTDDLTQVYNARFLKTALARELKRAGRFGQEVSLVMVGVDRFGAHCERQGDLRGSALLRETAAVLAQQVRSFDLLTRFGDERFMAVLPQTGRDGARLVAERMRTAVAFHAFTGLAPGDVTVSAAVSAFPQEGTEAPALLAAVERALAKAQPAEPATRRDDAKRERAA
jgi:diguanylate cyclase (GGDEF)-like protein